jgi:diadenylate cyclase
VQFFQDILSGSIPQPNIPTWIINVIDVMACAFIIYKVLQWIRLTRAWSLFKGFLFVLAIYTVAFRLGLVTILWIFNTTFGVGLIALVVIFQTEIRKALELLGKGSYFSFLSQDNVNEGFTHESAELIVKAAFEMSRVKTGALIAIEQKDSLSELIVNEGVKIDALITTQLLINIFEKNTPLHDGATIIQGGRVSAASVVIPALTEQAVEQSLGTRHRAAIGLSEAFDAIVVVVSEETGIVSAALGGKLHRPLDEKQLLTFLTSNVTASGGKSPLMMRLRRRKKNHETDLATDAPNETGDHSKAADAGFAKKSGKKIR